MPQQDFFIIDYSQWINAVIERAEKESMQRNFIRGNFKRKIDVLVDTFESRRDEVPGDTILVNVNETLDQLGYIRTEQQKNFHRHFICASLQHIYDESHFARYRTLILEKIGFKDTHTEVLIVTPRRFGKTTSVSMFCAAMLLSVQDIWISVFSTGKRASSSLADLTHRMICGFQNGKGAKRVVKKNQEELFLCSPDGNKSDIRRMYSYPSSVAVSIRHKDAGISSISST